MAVGGTRKLVGVGLVGMLAIATLGVGPVAARSGTTGGKAGDKTLYVVGAFETAGDSPNAIPHLDDGAKLAAEHLEAQGWDVTYERLKASGTLAASQDEAFATAQTKRPDVYMALPSSAVFVAVGPKVAATDVPTIGLSSPSEGVKTGSSGGDNIFLLRPLNEQTYTTAVDYACKKLKLKRLGLSLVNTVLGATASDVAKRVTSKYKSCEVVTEQTNSPTATDLTQQVIAFRDANVDGIITANFPNPTAVLINQLRQNGVLAPVLGNAGTGIVKDAGVLQSTDELYVFEDCTPDLNKDKRSKRFVRDYQARFGYPPNYASAQLYDAMMMSAQAVTQAGHDPARINKALSGMEYQGICRYATDRNNVLPRTITAYTYGPGGTKKYLETATLAFVPNEELVVATTTAPGA